LNAMRSASGKRRIDKIQGERVEPRALRAPSSVKKKKKKREKKRGPLFPRGEKRKAEGGGKGEDSADHSMCLPVTR